MKKIEIFTALLLVVCGEVVAQKINCKTTNTCFRNNEELYYEVYYNLGPIWVAAGDVTFRVEDNKFQNQGCYKFTGNGQTFKSYDWIFKVRDKFESLVDTISFRPLKYLRDTKEGSNATYNLNYFNNTKNVAYTFYKKNHNEFVKDTIGITSCTYDVMTMIYYARTIDYTAYKPNEIIPISIFLDAKVFNKQYIRYLGKAVLKTAIGTFNCIKFSPKLIAGTIFKEGDEMIVWVTDDKNKIPLLVETPIVVGSIQTKIKSIKGERHKLNKIEKK
jgi:hypothetical protein